jgi:hypothetical protein
LIVCRAVHFDGKGLIMLKISHVVSATLMLTLACDLGALRAEAQTTVRPAFGCFKVTAKSADIRERSNRTAAVVGTVDRGTILVKAGRFCTAGGNWCYVTTEKGLRGYADKSRIGVAACPARLSKPA